MKKIILAVVVCSAIVCCTTTASLERSWRDPTVTVDFTRLNKVLVVALLKNEGARRSAEDQLCALLKGKAVPSYLYLTKDIRQENEESIRQRIKNEDFDGVIFMRLVDVDKDLKYVPGQYPPPPYYGRFWGYYWYSWGAFYEPGHYETTKTYRIETNVYSLKSDKLIWSGITKSVDPANLDKLMGAVAKTVYKEMVHEGFITGVGKA